MNQLYVLSDKNAAPVSEYIYKAELELQTIVKENPHLLLEPKSGKKMFLIKPEFALPESEDSSNSFSLDHLMVDSDGVPVLVEVKRSKDTRIRREVVAQMLDYAARMRSVNVDSLRVLFNDNNTRETIESYSTNEFWEKVSANLNADRLSLCFVADAIPDTLITMMNFMRRTMPNIAVYGAEIREYKSEEATLLSTSIIGGYEAESIKIDIPTRQWDVVSFENKLRSLNDLELLNVVKDLQTSCATFGYSIVFGCGVTRPTFRGVIGKTTVFQVMIFLDDTHPKSNVEICLPALQRALGYEDDVTLRTLFNDFPNKETAIALKEIRNTPQYLYFDLPYFKDSQRRKLFLDKLSAVASMLKETN